MKPKTGTKSWVGLPTLRSRAKKLELIYANPSKAGSFLGINNLFKAAKEEIPALTRKEVKNFLLEKKEYT